MNSAITPEDIGIIVLAAGRSERFGTDKRFALLDNGQTLLESVLASVPESFTRKLLVLKPGDEQLADLYCSRWQICIAEDANAGMGNSLSNGIAMAGGWKGAVIALADMPFISPSTFAGIQSELTGNAIVIPCHDGRRGNPVGFRKQYFSEIGKLRGDQGARSLLEMYSADCYEMVTDDDGILRDIDSPDFLT